MTHARLRRVLGVVWIAVVATALYLALFQRGFVTGRFEAAAAQSIAAVGGLYFLLGCLRGFTLIPATSLVLVGIVFIPPWPLLVLTLAGILVSSASIYYFSEALHIEDLLKAKHARQLDRARGLLDRYGFPVIVLWAFLPIAPTDLICYLSGVLRIRVLVCLLGVLIGEGAICAIYIFLGHGLLNN